MEYNFIVCAPMQEKSEVSCSCIGNLFAPHEKLFLVRKKELEETDPSISRRANKSSELKNESEGKPQKKSLRKRNLSNFSAENSAPNTPNDPSRPEEARTHFGHDEPHLAFPRVEQHVFSAATFMPHPATTRHVDSPHKQKSYNPFGEQANYRPQPSPQFFPAPSRTLILQPTPRHSPSLTPQGAHMGRQPIGLAYLEEQPLEGYQLGLREGGESWMRREESLLIEDFDRLFSRDDALLEEKPARVREAQRSRRYQKQQLVGRLAESDDDAASDAHS